MRNSFLSVSVIVSVKVRIFPLNMRGIIIYVAWWWEKYLWKRSVLKHTCSWRDKVIVLGRLYCVLHRPEPPAKKDTVSKREKSSPSFLNYFPWILKIGLSWIEQVMTTAQRPQFKERFIFSIIALFGLKSFVLKFYVIQKE